MKTHDPNQAGNALYVEPPRSLLRKLVIESLIFIASMVLPVWAAHRWHLLDRPPTPIQFWIHAGIVLWYTAWALGFGGNFLRKAWLTASSGRHPHAGAFVFERTRVRYGAAATSNATIYAVIGVVILYGIVHVWVAMGIPEMLAAGVPDAVPTSVPAPR